MYTADREDLFQEILVNAWKAYPRFEGRSKFSTWLYRIALNTALMQLRKDIRHRKNEHVNVQDMPEEPAQEEWEDKEYRFLYSAIDRLDDVEKAVILLYLEELSYTEIAYILGFTENHVGVKINRIKKKLKDILEYQDHGS